MGARDGSALARLRRRAGAMVWAEGVAAAIAPAGCVLLAYVAVALFGGADAWVFGGFLGLALVGRGVGLAGMRRPTPWIIERRIEAASGLAHRPFAALADAPAEGGALTMEIWRAHQARAAAALATAQVGPPVAVAAARDPWALRGFLALLLITGGVIAGPAAPGRLAGAFALPAWPFAGPQVTLWIAPPAYDGDPPRLLTPGVRVTALAGSTLTVIVDGPRAAPFVAFGDAVVKPSALGETGHRADAVVMASGNLVVGFWWHRLARLRVDVVAPGAPVISVQATPLADGNHVKLAWHVADRYGLAGLRVGFGPVGAPGALVTPVALPLATGDGSGVFDLSTTPFILRPLQVTVVGRNLAGVEATADGGVIPAVRGLDLRDRNAAIVAFIRRATALTPAAVRDQAPGLQALSMAPAGRMGAGVDVKLAYLAAAMKAGAVGAPGAVDEMLALTQEIIAGPDYAPGKALAAADQALMNALRQGLNGQPPTPDGLAALLQAMRQALAQHLAALGQAAGQPAGGRMLDPGALDRMARQIAADEAAGRTAQAAQEMRQLQRVLRQLQSARPMTAAQMAQAQAGARAAGALGRMISGQARLLDRTHRGQGTVADQAGLQAQLNGLRQALGKAGMALPGLGDAAGGMQGAARALGRQDGVGAQAAENAAIAGLQQAAAALAAAAQTGFGIGQNAGPTMPGQDMDGMEGGPDEDVEPLDVNTDNPARVIQQQIIRQDSAPALPQPTHDYYRRLLQDGP